MNPKVFNANYSFNRIMSLINYIDNNAEYLLGMLNSITTVGEYQHYQKKYYNDLLTGIKKHADRLKCEWIDVAHEPQKLIENLSEFYTDCEKILQKFKNLQGATENIYNSEFFIDTQGNLIQLKKER